MKGTYTKIISKFLFASTINIALLSCEGVTYNKGKIRDVIDPGLNLTREEFEKKLLPDSKDSSANKNLKGEGHSASEPSIPDVTQILTAPKPPEAGPDKLVSISVTEDVPLKDVLIELGRLADVDMEIDPGISGGIILKATNRPFNEVMESVVELGRLRCEYKNGTLKIKRDLPYQVDYVTDFLNIVRSSTGNVSVSTNIIGGGSGSGASAGSSSSSSSSTGTGSGSGSGGITSGSNNAISSSYDGDLWKSVEGTIRNMLVGDASVAQSGTPQASPSASGGNQNGSGSSGSSAGLSSSGVVATNISSGQLPYTINKQAGVISVIATQKAQKSVEAYLSAIKRNISSQVLIEAKIVEVTLNKTYNSGINWGVFTNKSSGVSLTGNFNPISSSTPAGVLNLGATITKDGSNNLTSVVGLLDKFGTARTIASPRLHAMNNQQAVMTVAQNKVYFTVQAQDATSSSTSASGTPTTTSSITSTLHTVPIGIIMTLEPSINLETNEVTMNIRPTLTTTTTSVDDPAVALTSQKNISSSSSTKSQPVTSSIPIIDVRELDSVMKLKSGEVMVMGGLMKSDVTNQDAGVPGVSKIPFFGNAFKSVVKTNNTVETVIFIKATIIPSDGMVVKADKALYKNFFRDPRPLAF